MVFLAVVSLADGAEYSLIINDFDTDTAFRVARPSLPGNFPFSRRSRRVTLTPLIATEKGLTQGDTLTLNLFSDKAYTARIDRVATNINSTVVVRGRIEGYSLGYVLISTTGERSLGSVCVPEKGEYYIIQSEPDNRIHYLLDVNVDQLGELKDGPTPIPPLSTPQEVTETEMPTVPLETGPLDPITIDVMVVYTPAARQWANSSGGGIANVISQAMAKAQLALDNSNTILAMNLVYSGEVSYTESGSSNTDLDRLTSTSDGYIDEVHTLRNQYGADLVTLYSYVEDVGGLGWLLTSTSGSPGWAFCITRVQQASWTYTHIHEMGHNMGCHHRKDQVDYPGPGLFSYSAGWRWVGSDSGKYCSVMSYEEDWYSRVAHFSNPDILYKGVATGDAADGDNARTIREIKAVVARYRNSPPKTPSPVSPANGATGVSITPLLQASAFLDSDGDSHANSRWQVSRNSGFTDIAWDSGDSYQASIQTTVPSGRLTYLSTYYWRVRYKDNRGAWSNWASSRSFTVRESPGEYSGGSGTSNDPYRIATPQDLNDIGNYPGDWDKYFILINDVNIAQYTGTQFKIIGNSETKFTGVFDGNNRRIWNFTWSSNGTENAGLFGYIGSSSQIKNLGMENVNVNIVNGCWVGGLVGSNEGEITNCYLTGSVSGSYAVGGLAGENSGTISSCYSTGITTGDSDVGGLVGDNGYETVGTITDCYSTGSTSGGHDVGGLVGWNPGTVANCYSTGGASGDLRVGGLVGENWWGAITDCYSTGSVTGPDGAGGMVGWNFGTITNCYSTGGVTGDSDVGGLVGYEGGTVTASFWDVNTSGQSTSASGTPKTTAEMKTKSTFTDAGWDFVNIWDICEGTNYPRLQWQIPPARARGDFLCPYGVDFVDFAVLASAWQTELNDPDWNPACDISQPKDNFIDELDLAILCKNWLEGTAP